MKKVIFSCLLVCFATLFTSCGGGGGGGDASIFSVWVNDADGAVIDISKSQLAVPNQLLLILVTGETCTTWMTVVGTEQEGRMLFDVGTGSCAQFDGWIDSYSISGNTATSCPVNHAGGCETYHVA